MPTVSPEFTELVSFDSVGHIAYRFMLPTDEAAAEWDALQAWLLRRTRRRDPNRRQTLKLMG